MGSKWRYKRKLLNLSVNRDMQFHMIAKIALILMASLLISSASYYFLANQEINSSFRLFHVQARTFLDFLLPVIIGSFLVSLVIGTAASLFFPKSVAGGLYRIEQEVQKVTKGDLTVNIKLRKGDEVESLAGQINQLVDGFRREIAGIRSSLDRAEDLLSPETGLSSAERLEGLREIHGLMLGEIAKLKVTEGG